MKTSTTIKLLCFTFGTSDAKSKLIFTKVSKSSNEAFQYGTTKPFTQNQTLI